jgi:hypothetical protein
MSKEAITVMAESEVTHPSPSAITAYRDALQKERR